MNILDYNSYTEQHHVLIDDEFTAGPSAWPCPEDLKKEIEPEISKTFEHAALIIKYSDRVRICDQGTSAEIKDKTTGAVLCTIEFK